MATTHASFDPPAPGSWTLDTDRFPRPATRYVIEVFPRPARGGFERATRRYGLLLSHIRWAFVERWAYLSPRPVPALRDHLPVTRQRWDELVRTDEALRARLADSARVFEERRWRADIRRWDDERKPALRRSHEALQRVDVSSLDDEELAVHLDRCRDDLRRAIHEHHLLNVAPVLPVGDLLVRAQRWTGRPPTDLLALVRTHGPTGDVETAALARLTDALRGDRTARADLAADDPLTRLTARPGEVGAAAVDYLALVGHRSAGGALDISEPRLVEIPGLLARTIQAALDADRTGDRGEEVAELAAEVRAEVPTAQRTDFDRALEEAHSSHRVRDERATYCDVWAYGLVRRAVLAAGERLVERGVVDEPGHLVEADHEEMCSLLGSGVGPSGDELAARARVRLEATADGVPEVLGDPPRRPVPVGWLPAGAARTERAFRTYVAAMSADDGPLDEQPTATIRGLPASAGTYEGRARVVRDAAALATVEAGDVVVIGSTSPALHVVLSLAGAIVTDRGGQLSHAAIVAREFGVPAVVGTGDATMSIPEGAVVLVDGAAGEVRIRT